jgi:hypothetical protein
MSRNLNSAAWPWTRFLKRHAMKIENFSNYEQQAGMLNQKPPAFTAHTRGATDCLIIKIPPPEEIAQWKVTDDARELKRILRDLRWTGMISDALVVLAITAAIYISPSLETLRAVVQKTAISVAEASRAR